MLFSECLFYHIASSIQIKLQKYVILKLNKGYNVEVETIQLEFVQNYHYNIYYSFMYFFTCRPNLNLRNMLACRRCFIYLFFRIIHGFKHNYKTRI